MERHQSSRFDASMQCNNVTRALTTAEQAHLADVLTRLREHFPQWPEYLGHEHDLISFAFYEGCGDSSCCGDILAEAAPFALGSELVKHYGFQWVALKDNAPGCYGVCHPALPHPIHLHALEDGTWCDITATGDWPRGQRTNESLAGIVRAVGRQVKES